MALVVASLIWSGCGDKTKSEDDTAVDTVPDTIADTTADDDPVPDTIDDADATADPDVVEDGDVMDAPDVDDCVPDGTVGSPPSDATAACAMVGACVNPSDPSSAAGSCMTFGLLGDWQPLYGRARDIQVIEGLNNLWQAVHDNATAVAAATDCDDLFRVLNGGSASTDCTLLSADFPAWPTGCRSGDLVYCVNVDPTNTDGREVVVPCSAGTSCQTVMGLMSACFVNDCTTADDEAVCRGGNIDQCVMAGRHMIIDCDELARGAGGECAMIDDGSGTGSLTAGCIPTGDACDSSAFTDTCVSAVLTRCAEDHEYDTSCADIGTDWDCSDSTPDCIPDLSAWTCTVPRGGVCDCDDLVFCDATAGQDVRIVCADYGLRTCEVDGTGAAMCAP
jgi:hypothetical protein